MAEPVKHGGPRRGIPWRVLGWGAAALLLLLPLVGMRFSEEMDWDAFDFILAGALLGGIGLGLELAARKGNRAYRMAAGVALVTATLIVLANGTVGLVGSEDNPYNLVFGGVLLIALLGAILSRFEPAGMARAMVVTAIAQGVAAAVGLPMDGRGAALSATFAAPWLLAALLFRNAAQEQAAASPQH